MEKAAVLHRYPFRREHRIWTGMPLALSTSRSPFGVLHALKIASEM